MTETLRSWPGKKGEIPIKLLKSPEALLEPAPPRAQEKEKKPKLEKRSAITKQDNKGIRAYYIPEVIQAKRDAERRKWLNRI